MRMLILVGWLLAPIGVAIWHYGPGQVYAQLDAVAGLLALADRAAAAGDSLEAANLYDQALQALPENKTQERRRIRLELAKARMLSAQLPTANQDLKTLAEELTEDARTPPALLAEARSALAQSQYYMTWLMRLEGEPRELWEPEIEAARQNYRLLAEKAALAGDEATGLKSREDLESAIRLARMDLSELQGLSLPCQCQGCCSGKCAGRRKPGKTKGPKQGPPKDARGASSGPPPDNGGH